MVTASKKRKQRQTQGNKNKSASTTAKSKEREVVHEEVSVEYQEPITIDKAKELLGWEEEGESNDAKFGNNFVPEIRSLTGGAKVRCSNNVTNRPLYMGKIMELGQDILRKRWNFNGEPIIIGRTGLVLNGQHTLIAFIISVMQYLENPDSCPMWDEEPTLAKLIVYGVQETDEVVNTMDTCKPRSLLDVIYRAGYFKKLKGKDQRKVSNAAQFSIKMLWERIGLKGLTIKRTHAESIDFLERHPKLLEAIKYTYEENSGDEKRISRFISPGYAASMLYLMATSNSDPDAYYKADQQNEKLLDFAHWDRACEFFVELAGGSTVMKPIRDALGKLASESIGEEGKIPVTICWAVLVKAWNQYKHKKPVTAKTVTLAFEVKDDHKRLAESPLLGGIDIGDEEPSEPNPETKNHVSNGKAKARAKKEPKSDFVASKKGATWDKDDKAWYHFKAEDALPVMLLDHPYNCHDNVERVMVEGPDGQYEVAVIDLYMKQFEKK